MPSGAEHQQLACCRIRALCSCHTHVLVHCALQGCHSLRLLQGEVVTDAESAAQLAAVLQPGDPELAAAFASTPIAPRVAALCLLHQWASSASAAAGEEDQAQAGTAASAAARGMWERLLALTTNNPELSSNKVRPHRAACSLRREALLGRLLVPCCCRATVELCAPQTLPTLPLPAAVCSQRRHTQEEGGAGGPGTGAQCPAASCAQRYARLRVSAHTHTLCRRPPSHPAALGSLMQLKTSGLSTALLLPACRCGFGRRCVC